MRLPRPLAIVSFLGKLFGIVCGTVLRSGAQLSPRSCSAFSITSACLVPSARRLRFAAQRCDFACWVRVCVLAGVAAELRIGIFRISREIGQRGR